MGSFLSKISISLTTKRNLIKIDVGKEFVKKSFQKFTKPNDVERHSLSILKELCLRKEIAALSGKIISEKRYC